MALSFGWKIKIFGSIFLDCNLTFWSDSHRTLNCILFLKYTKCIDVEWELEQICYVSLLTNQVIKVVHSCLKSFLE